MAEGGVERPGRMERSGANSTMKVSGSSMGSRISDGAIEDLLSSSEALEQLPRVGCCDGPTDERGIVVECDGQGAAARPSARGSVHVAGALACTNARPSPPAVARKEMLIKSIGSRKTSLNNI